MPRGPVEKNQFEYIQYEGQVCVGDMYFSKNILHDCGIFY